MQPDPGVPGAFRVLVDGSSQAWVDPTDPLRLEFEYVQRITEVLDVTLLSRPAIERVRIVHLGGSAMMIPRWVEARRPHTAQIVCEPDAETVADVRRLIPLPHRSGIKIRETDGRSALRAMPDDYADAIVLDAFVGYEVPAELATLEFFTDIRRVLRPGGVFLANVVDHAPHPWVRRFVAGLPEIGTQIAASAEAAMWKGRRFGNVVTIASDRRLPMDVLIRRSASAPFPYQWRYGRELVDMVGRASPFTDADPQPSPTPSRRFRPFLGGS